MSKEPHLNQKGSDFSPHLIYRNLSIISEASSHSSFLIFPSLSMYKGKSKPWPSLQNDNSGRRATWLYSTPTIVAEPTPRPRLNGFLGFAFGESLVWSSSACFSWISDCSSELGWLLD